MPYVFLALAICAEITATTLLKSSEGYTRLLPTAFSLLAYLTLQLFPGGDKTQFGNRLRNLVRRRDSGDGCDFPGSVRGTGFTGGQCGNGPDSGGLYRDESVRKQIEGRQKKEKRAQGLTTPVRKCYVKANLYN